MKSPKHMNFFVCYLKILDDLSVQWDAEAIRTKT
jgi:hypothetical protein